ncbi:hypothetical protein MNBD_ALPHA04-1977 [hydrothermal vent metagenome]|uniref:Lipoprotein n=1 Tax=hydrothermal vent metagenome TaxID=652676 RepID=A0A3B0SLQ6_9ZZZZ
MKIFMKYIVVIAAPLLLTGCFFLPGKFDATLKLNKGGAYEFTYVGEMQIIAEGGKDMKPPEQKIFNPENARCSDWVERDGSKSPSIYYDEYASDGSVEDKAEDAPEKVSDAHPHSIKRACTKEEIATLEQREIETYERRKKDYDQRSGMMAAMFGGAVPGNDKALKKFAETLKKYDGWDKVEYAGDNMFNVEYRASGTFDRYFAFPILNDATIQYPFFQIVPRKDGALEVMTPAVGGSGSLMTFAMLGGMKGGSENDMPIRKIEGSFTLETDGEILVNNSADGYETDGEIKTIHWKIQDVSESPRALIRLK